MKIRQKISYPLLTMLFVILLCFSYSSEAKSFISFSQNSDEEIKAERKFFDFLIGEWVIEKADTPNGTELRSDDTFNFKRAVDGGGIVSEWYFNRGTKAQPDYARATYVSAFDNSTKTWSFYYVSEKSAQYWEGKKENGQWVFYKKFMVNGEELLQRQSWVAKDASTLLRKIENSKDGGKSWAVNVFTYKRK